MHMTAGGHLGHLKFCLQNQTDKVECMNMKTTLWHEVKSVLILWGELSALILLTNSQR